jgi:hypothetical protein
MITVTKDELLEQAYEFNVRVEQILHIPTMITDSESVCDPLKEFIEQDITDHVDVISPFCRNLKALVEDYDEDDDRYWAQDVAHYLFQNLTAPYLIQVAYQVRKYRYKQDPFPCGTMVSGWGYYQTKWVVANSPEDGLEQGIEMAKAHVQKAWDEAGYYQQNGPVFVEQWDD